MSRDLHARRSGCFVVFWVLFLLLLIGAEAGLIWWMNPGWFDRLAFWRGPIYPPETVILPPGPDDDLPPPGPPAADDAGFSYWEEGRVRAAYGPAAGATLRTPEGAEFTIPLGAIDGTPEVSLTPVVNVPEALSADGVLPVGPLYDLRVGEAAHSRFRQPVRVSVPFRSDDRLAAETGSRPAVGVWDGRRWEVLPTTVDDAARRLTAETGHASLIGVITIIGVSAGGSAIKFTEPGRALWKLLSDNLEYTYKTDNFAVHYNRGAPAGAPDDITYLLSQRRKSAAHPLFVMDIGRYLEDARLNLPLVKLKVSRPLMIRYDVFLVPMTEFGSSELGGPVLLDNDFSFGGSTVSSHLEYQMRATSAHELIHVAQDDYFNISNAGGYRWWLEVTAEYLSHRLMRLQNRTNAEADYYIRSEPELLATPLNRAENLQPYAYAHFFNWMENKAVNVAAAIEEVNGTGAPDLPTLNRAFYSARGATLLQLFTEYAREFYHRNLWTGAIIPAAALETHYRSSANAFTVLTRQDPRQPAVRLYVHGQTAVPLPPLSARHFLFRAEGMPARRPAKLVVCLSGARAGNGLEASVGAFQSAGGPLFAGAPAALTSIPLDTGPETGHLVERVVAPAERTGDVNRVSLLVVNASADTEQRLTIRRWLLLPPEYVASERRDDGSYRLQWHRAELKDSGGDAFKGYNVYRRHLTDAQFPKQPVNAQPVEAEEFVDQPPAGAFYAYTVTVVDRLGNESEPAPLDEGELFVGLWEGKFSLTKGKISDLVIRTLRHQLAQSGEAGASSGVGPLLEKARLVLENIDLLLKVGIPVTMEITRSGGAYQLVPRTAFGRPIKDPKPLPLQRAGLHSLAFVPDKPGGRGFVLNLKRKDEIDRTIEHVEDDPDIGRVELSVRLALTRTNPPPALLGPGY